MPLNQFFREITALILGLTLPLAYAPFNLYLLSPLLLAGLIILIRNVTPFVALRIGLFFGLGWFGVGVSWVYVAIHEFGNTAPPLAAIFTLLFCLYLALFPALFAYLSRSLSFRFGIESWRYYLLLIPLLWGATEWLRGWLLTGFPWLNPAFSQIDSPLVGWAPIVGIYGLNLILALLAGLLSLIYSRMIQGRYRNTLSPLLITLGLWLGGYLLSMVEWSRPLGRPVNAALIQGNVDQQNKWKENSLENRFKIYNQLSQPYIGNVDLILWPENALTAFYHRLRPHYLVPLEQQFLQSRTELLFGVPILDDNQEDYYTSMITLNHPEQHYAKRHLVPFGEYLPLKNQLQGLINFFAIPMSGFSRGSDSQGPLQILDQKLGVSICYEDLFPSELIAQVRRGATLLINGSNNGWYGDSFAPHQHLEIARMYSLLTARPTLRVTTSGISAIIGHQGEIVAQSPQFVSTSLNGEVQPRQGQTPFVRWGEWSFIALLLMLLLPLLLLRKVNSSTT